MKRFGIGCSVLALVLCCLLTACGNGKMPTGTTVTTPTTVAGSLTSQEDRTIRDGEEVQYVADEKLPKLTDGKLEYGLEAMYYTKSDGMWLHIKVCNGLDAAVNIGKANILLETASKEEIINGQTAGMEWMVEAGETKTMEIYVPSTYVGVKNDTLKNVESQVLLEYKKLMNAAGDFPYDTAFADIEIAGYGTITVQLEPKVAPITVQNFVNLAESGFYDGLTFHRIIKDFVIQGGDPEGTGRGGSDTNIFGEFTANGFNNPLKHTRGAISMARSGDPDSASSQFFIVHQTKEHLDGQYAVFGYVINGMDVVDAVCAAATPIDDNGTIPAGQQPIINRITIRYPATY